MRRSLRKSMLKMHLFSLRIYLHRGLSVQRQQRLEESGRVLARVRDDDVGRLWVQCYDFVHCTALVHHVMGIM